MLVPFAFRALVAPLAIALALAIGLPLGPKPLPVGEAASLMALPISEQAPVAGGALTILPPDGAAFAISLETLRSLKRTQFTTSTIWTDGSHHFTGVALADLLAHLNAGGQTVEAMALNDYAAMIPPGDLRHGAGPVIAYEMDGQPLPRRGFGPLWLLYPFDSSAYFRTESVYARSVTQLNRLRLDP
ncbi:molybdopterin-dependent oxidoreductase [Pseudoruegeria sp. SHC-113]|uniref:molybdopterin-dependent oxidoreductase n=1 Tax=Pseudoruegeria sp. SHC-113 TaxID=2855439 RepID=UPI0021BAFC4C|nr:molybdopterin-dependent oxidoreductase [Pseudoruegeria sp. SHC-113]MCT8160093.1 molybdopterin-dependent oxidoreductase [Pseudoruegeria sp. SHC-113]